MIVPTSAGKADATDRKAASPLDRVLRALNHPIRRRILRVMVDGTGSASTISRKIDMELGVVSYHLNQVLAKECDIVELVDTVPRRGAIEKIYRLKFHALTVGDPGAGDEDRKLPRRMSLEECFIVAVAAMEADAFETLEGSAWDWSLTQVDAEAWREIGAAGAEFNRRTREAAARSRQRGGEDDPHNVVVGAAVFPAASPVPPAA